MKGDIVLLKFIFGLPSSGKTTTVLNLIKEKTDLSKKVVLIVPEQFSFQTERSILKLLGDSNAHKVEVLSFTRLYDEISNSSGGICGKLLSDSDKIILMNRTLSSLQGELTVWGKYAHSINFSKTILDIIGEFKVNAISPKEIRNAADKANKKSLKNKLYDIALIYENFDAILGEKYIDPVDKLTKVYRDLENNEYFKGKTVFFDSFKAFTGQQFKIIDRIMKQTDEIFVAINNDMENQQEFDVFSNLRKNIQRIMDIAKNNGLTVDEPIILSKSHYTNQNLCSLERLMAGQKEKCDLADTITICRADNIFDEAEFVARNIRRLVREKGYRFRDFVIIARDTDRYQQAVEYALKKNDIACFFDKRVGLNSLPFTFAVDAAISALDLSTENILRYHKCGFSNLSTDEISALENYAYLWNIGGKLWLDEWEMDPRGFETSEMKQTEQANLKEINRLRLTALKPILSFKNHFGGNAAKMATAIVKLLENCDAKNTLLNLSKRFEATNCDISPDVLKQGYERFMAVLDGIVACFGEKSITKDEFYEALTLALSTETVGVIPQFLDEVSFGSADRIQPARPKVAFILGANQGVFPQTVSSLGLLSANERKLLNDYDIKISDNAVSASIDEDYLVYSNVTCPSEMLFISYAVKNLKGDELQPSPFVNAVIDNLSPKCVNESLDSIFEENLPETKAAAFSDFCRRFNSESDKQTLLSAFNNDEKFTSLSDYTNLLSSTIKPENAERLYGKTINLSATKIDTVNRCKFSYFCKYGLKAERLKPAEFNVLQRGNIAHYVLESIIEKYKEKVKDLTEIELCNLTDFYIEDYLSKINGFEKVRDAKAEFIIKRISRSLKEVVCHIANDFRQSNFKPVACEFKIGFDDGIKVNFPYDNGEIKINGSIDRVDEYKGYIRIVDYKTGTKTFKLPDVLYGLNMQMLIYLYAITRGQGKDDEQAAAILYMPAKRDVNDNGLAMNGLIKADVDIHNAMEKDNNGIFVPPISLTASGSVSKRSASFIDKEDFTLIFNHIESVMRKTGNSIIGGDISIAPLDGRESNACKYCDFKNVCNIENRIAQRVPSLKNAEVFERMKEAEENGI